MLLKILILTLLYCFYKTQMFTFAVTLSLIKK